MNPLEICLDQINIELKQMLFSFGFTKQVQSFKHDQRNIQRKWHHRFLFFFLIYSTVDNKLPFVCVKNADVRYET